MHESLVQALGRTRARLNAVIALHRALSWAAPSAVASGILVAASRVLGLHAAGFVLWAALSLAGAVAGALASRASFLGEEGAARWLDERLGDDELLSAAVACLRRGSEGRFDEDIALKAEGLLPRAAGIKAPRGPLAKRAATAAAAFAIGAYLLFLSGTTTAALDARTARARLDAGRSPASKAATAASALGEGGKAAADFASSLFPDDKRMATLTERALREGRIDDLRGILKAAGLDLDTKLAGHLTETERKKFAGESARLGDAMQALALAAQAQAMRKGGAPGNDKTPRDAEGMQGGGGTWGPGSRPWNPDSAPGGGNGPGGNSRRGPGAQGRSPNAGPGEGEGSGGGEGRNGEAAAGSGGAAGKGGKGYGVGSGAEGDWGSIKPASGKGRMDIAEPKNPAYFELVLPGKEASSPVSSLAPGSGRSAEAAMSREGLPLEYEDFVRSYFMALSKGESR
jgi:hypothetical protein